VDEIVIPQVREILTDYGDISIIWWDIPGGVIDKPRADRIFKTVMGLKPDIVMNNRLGGGYKGDTETPEQHIPATGMPGRDWETCMTMNGTWGFKQDDQNWKSPAEMIRMLCDIASKGGNYLLNVGPTCEGEIPKASLDSLAEIGKWMKVNGEAIYATSPSPFPGGVPWGRVTQKGKKLYLMVFDRPKDGALLLPGLKTRVKSAHFLADAKKKPLAAAAGEQGVTIALPEGISMDPAATVVAVELADKPEVGPAVPPAQPR
jgi:alpha-L-fucosidase